MQRTRKRRNSDRVSPRVSRTDTAFHATVTRAFARMLPRADRTLAELLVRNGVGRATVRLQLRLCVRNIGRAAGQVRGDVLTINSQLVAFPDEVPNTLAHELAHAVVDAARRRLRIRHRRGAWSPHGAAWKSVARQLGDSGDRCHRMPLSPMRQTARFLYRLPDGTERILGAIRHNRLQRNRNGGYLFRGDAEPVRGRHFVAELEHAPARKFKA